MPIYIRHCRICGRVMEPGRVDSCLACYWDEIMVTRIGEVIKIPLCLRVRLMMMRVWRRFWPEKRASMKPSATRRRGRKHPGSQPRDKRTSVPLPVAAKPDVAVRPPSRPAKNPVELLQKARAYERAQDWSRAKTLATEAVEANPSLIDAMMIRALCCRCLGTPNDAIADYTRVIRLDPENGDALMFRGACKTQIAADMDNPEARMNLLNDAYPDYRRAAELMPGNELAGLALLELEICIGKYREAVGTTGEWWNRVQYPPYKVVCAWLGAIALILAGRPESRWSHFVEFLEQERARLGPTDWCVTEIDRCLGLLEDNGIATDVISRLLAIHKLFLGHFVDGGPAMS